MALDSIDSTFFNIIWWDDGTMGWWYDGWIIIWCIENELLKKSYLSYLLKLIIKKIIIKNNFERLFARNCVKNGILLP